MKSVRFFVAAIANLTLEISACVIKYFQSENNYTVSCEIIFIGEIRES